MTDRVPEPDDDPEDRKFYAIVRYFLRTPPRDVDATAEPPPPGPRRETDQP